MRKQNQFVFSILMAIGLVLASCHVPALVQVTENKTVPATFDNRTDTASMALSPWRTFYADKYLTALIDTAIKNNQELLITLQEIEIVRNDIQFRQGPLRPTIAARLGIGVDKVGRYTSQGAGDAATEIEKGKEMPEALPDITAALSATWEIDIWKKLRNAKKAAIVRYLSTVEGKNFLLTNLVGEVAASYYELLALDNQLEIVQQNIALQKNALEIVKVQKEASRATELAVQKFSAEVSKTQSLEYGILQQIKATENRINFLLARFPQTVARDSRSLMRAIPAAGNAGIPSQLLANRADIRQSELALMAAKLDVQVARAEFYPSFEIRAVLGFQAFKPAYLLRFPESLLYSLAGDLAAPLINRNTIKAEFASANARQLQAMYNYEKSILNACLEVSTQLSNIENLQKSFEVKSKQVDALTRSIDIANDLFKSARADYLEVLMTQRDALEAKLELVETKKDQLNAMIGLYRGLGGGWR